MNIKSWEQDIDITLFFKDKDYVDGTLVIIDNPSNPSGTPRRIATTYKATYDILCYPCKLSKLLSILEQLEYTTEVVRNHIQPMLEEKMKSFQSNRNNNPKGE